ncbi:MAG: 1-acyl-sn-glycerol-3-phosphate acyltransferase [Myxococcaceae bacterium]|nr:1-acyl-sn-glycerol-3-phosphate acyltransferase [Myxococcaceae bacterium]
MLQKLLERSHPLREVYPSGQVHSLVILRIYQVAFWTFFASTSAIYFVGAFLLWLFTLPFDKNQRALHLYSCFWAMTYVYINPGWRFRVERRDRLPWHGPAVLVSNHQSAGDILVLFGLYSPYKWVSKASIFKAPFLGWNMSLNGYVQLVRGDKESIGRMMAHCEQWLDRGVPVLMFPEGTRSEDGNVKPFKDGAFRLSIAKNCPVVPIMLEGTGQTLAKNALDVSPRGNLIVKVLEPVQPGPFNGDVAALRDHVRGLIIAELAATRGVSPPAPAAPPA